MNPCRRGGRKEEEGKGARGGGMRVLQLMPTNVGEGKWRFEQIEHCNAIENTRKKRHARMGEPALTDETSVCHATSRGVPAGASPENTTQPDRHTTRCPIKYALRQRIVTTTVARISLQRHLPRYRRTCIQNTHRKMPRIERSGMQGNEMNGAQRLSKE